MSLLRKLASQTAVYGLSTMVGRFINFLLVPLYTARLAGSSEYGEVSVVFSYASFLAIIFTYGMETGFFNFARNAEKPAKVFSTATIALLLSGFALVLLGFFFAQPLMNAAGYPKHPEYATWFAIILAADAITSLGFAWLRFEEKPWAFAAIRLANIGINVGANLFFLLVCPWLQQHGYSWINSIYDPGKLVQYIFISNLLASVITLLLFTKTWKHLKAGFDRELFKKMLAYSWPIVIIGLAGMINETLDRILLKQLLPANIADSEAGIYSAFYKLSLVLTLFVQAFRFAAEPFFFKQAGSDDAKASYAYVMKWFVYVCGFIFVATMVFLPWLGSLLIRNKVYFEDSRGMQVVPILLLANLFLGIYYNLSIWYKLSNKTKLGAATAIIGAAVTLLGNFFFIQTHSFVASAWTTLAAYFTMVLVAYVMGRKYYNVPYPVGKILLTIGAAMALGYVAWEYNKVSMGISIFVIPVFLLFVWWLEAKSNVRSKNKKRG
ncbi:MAG: oligosaccharide flippase family protein [Bacteroidia bacterium]|nr:oligosaccharide flippase family protein [Bacteroidia bacterium]